jgi:hypothetical protein
MAVSKLADSLQSALDLLDEAAYATSSVRLEAAEQGTLLQQCLALCEMQQSQPVEPVRTVHHFACTGGTLISKCIAAMPNVQLLSELDPLSTMQFKSEAKPKFAPTDMTTQLRQSTRGVHDDLLIDLFRNDLRMVHAQTAGRGIRLVLRDHAHSQFCVGTSLIDRPTVLELLPPDIPVRSLVTVRHPLASFASVLSLKWETFSPATVDEYCRRQLAFLDRYSSVPVVRYEDFVAQPAQTMQVICDHLLLPYSEGFEDLISVFKISGDSGRSGARIQARAPRPESQALVAEASASAHFHQLTARLGYAEDIAVT